MAAEPAQDATLSTVDAERELLADRPSSDQLAMERARENAERTLFGQAEPARFGRYQVLDRLAGGGMGLVYAAYDPELGRKVALKVVLPGRGTLDAHARLLGEARALAQLDHGNVVTVHDIVSHGGQIVIVMELLEGETLASWEAASPREWRDIVAAYVQAGQGLVAAHSIDVIHRDFKPSNAIMGAEGRVRVLDFGLARVATDATMEAGGLHRTGSPVVVHTVPGAFVGTPAYASPEQLAGRSVTAASDQFSFCVALHRALEGVAPFWGGDVEQLLASIHAGDVRLASIRSEAANVAAAWISLSTRRTTSSSGRGLAPPAPVSN